MKNLAKKLSIGALSLMLLSFNMKAQPELTKQDSIELNNINRSWIGEYDLIGTQPKKKEYRWLEEPGLYAAPFILGATLFEISYSNNNLSSSERSTLSKTTVPVLLTGVAICVGAYFLSDKIIDNRKKRKHLEKKY